jgi:hypothetical protein
VNGDRFLVRCLSSDTPWVWLDIVQPPLAVQIPGDSRLMVSCAETFNAACFSNPWAMFGRPVVYDISEVPVSNTLPAVLAALTASEQPGKGVERDMNSTEGAKVKPAEGAKAKRAKAKPAKGAKTRPAKGAKTKPTEGAKTKPAEGANAPKSVPEA